VLHVPSFAEHPESAVQVLFCNRRHGWRCKRV